MGILDVFPRAMTQSRAELSRRKPACVRLPSPYARRYWKISLDYEYLIKKHYEEYPKHKGQTITIDYGVTILMRKRDGKVVSIKRY